MYHYKYILNDIYILCDIPKKTKAYEQQSKMNKVLWKVHVGQLMKPFKYGR